MPHKRVRLAEKKTVATDTESRQARERAFHDELFADGGLARDDAGRFYTVVESSRRRYWRAVDARSPGADCVEYGSAQGADTLQVAARAKSVMGFDVSPVAVGQARVAAVAHAHGDRVRFEVAGAEQLPLADASVDLAFGNSVLHHLELEPAVREMARVLRPAGSAVFAEPLGHNPLINWYRRRTPEMRTPDEHPLLRPDLDLMARYFTEARFEFFNLASLAAVSVAGRRCFPGILRTLERLDAVALGAIAPLRYHAWVCLIVLQGPRPPHRVP